MIPFSKMKIVQNCLPNEWILEENSLTLFLLGKDTFYHLDCKSCDKAGGPGLNRGLPVLAWKIFLGAWFNFSQKTENCWRPSYFILFQIKTDSEFFGFWTKLFSKDFAFSGPA